MSAALVSRLWPWLAAAFSGLLLALCFPPYNVGGFAFVALIPLLCAIWIKRPARRAGWYWFRLGYVTGLVFFTTTFWWLSELGPLFQNGALRFLSFYLSLYLALYIAVWAWLAGWLVGRHFETLPPPDPLAPFSRPPLLLSTRNLAIGFTLAAAWAVLDWARGLGKLSFGWNPLGVALHKEVTLIQIVEWTGVPGLSFLLVLCNVIGLITILRLKAEVGRTRIRPHFDFSFTVAVVVVCFSYGVRILAKGGPAESTPLRVATIQPNIPQTWKLYETNIEEIFARLDRLHGYASAASPHLVLWPEASIPGGMLANQDTFDFVRELASRVPALLVGTDDVARDRNSTAFFTAGKAEPVFYDKQHLVPFGEYLPFRPLLGWALADLVPGDFQPGTEPGVMQLPEPRLGLAPLICFEDTVAGLTRIPVQQGADVLINITNDGWFGLSSGNEHHFINSIFRAVENRRPLLRSTNTGVTASVDRFGRVDRWLDPFTLGTVQRQVSIPKETGMTFYTRNGDVFAWSCLGLTLVAIVFRIGTSRRKA